MARRVLTTVISLPAAFRNAFVQRTFLGLRFILIVNEFRQSFSKNSIVFTHLKFLLHLRMRASAENADVEEGETYFELQNRKTFASFRTNALPSNRDQPKVRKPFIMEHTMSWVDAF